MCQNLPPANLSWVPVSLTGIPIILIGIPMNLTGIPINLTGITRRISLNYSGALRDLKGMLRGMECPIK